jgi:hypothetical protein
MGRSLQSAKRAGASFEQQVAEYLAQQLDQPAVERRHLSGVNDRGDISGLFLNGERVVIECKNYGGRLEPSAWLKELATEMANDKAKLGAVIAKRKGVTATGEQYVLLTVDQFLAFITNL